MENLQQLTLHQKRFIISLHKKYPEITLGLEPSLEFLTKYASSLLQQVRLNTIKHSTFKKYFSYLNIYFIHNNWSNEVFRSNALRSITTYSLRSIPINYLPAKNPRLLITLKTLETACQSTISSKYKHDDVVITTCALVCFFGLARTYELLHPLKYNDTMNWTHVSETPMGDHRITLTHPKITKYYTQYIQPIRHDGILNPQLWLTILNTLTSNKSDMWQLSSGSRLSTNSFLSSFAQLAKINPTSLDCSAFRAGGATYLLHSGYSHTFIKTFGRWNSDSFIVYLRTLPDAFYHITTSSTN